MREGMRGTSMRWWAWVVAGMAVGWTGCGGGKQADGREGGPPRAVLVGRVASVPADRQFVLIQSYGTWSVAPGEPVFSAGPDGRTANLLPTGERLGQFLAADLRSGNVVVGDAVYFRPKKQATPAATGAQAPTGGPAGGGQPAGGQQAGGQQAGGQQAGGGPAGQGAGVAD